MSVLCDIGILVAPTFRSRAYAQWTIRAGLRPACALMLPGHEPNWDGPKTIRVDIQKAGCEETFEPGKSARASLEEANIPIFEMPVGDINDAHCIAALQSLPQSIIIYSGFGAVLLRKDILACGKRFLHVHGGVAPRYRGSTAFYYSLLKEKKIGATALWLEEQIDTGPILARREYPMPYGIEIDRIADPLVRADLLCQVLADAEAACGFPPGERDNQGAETYHVIHPVLKHLALKTCGLLEGANA